MQSTASQQQLNKNESSQVRIYNRYFYKKGDDKKLLQDISQREIKMAANLPKITPSSYAILSKKMLVELEKHITSIVGEAEVSYEAVEQLVRIYLHQCSMSKNDSNAAREEQQEEKYLAEQLYLILCHYNLETEPTVQALFSILRVLLDPYGHSTSEQLSLIKGLDTFQHIEEDRRLFISENSDCADQTIPIGQLLQIWRKLRLRNNSFEKTKEHPELGDLKQSSFKPTVGKKSEQLADKRYKEAKQQLQAAHTASGRRIDRYEVLYNTKIGKDIPKLKVETGNQCTFKPEINRSSTCRNDTSQDIVERLYHIPQRKERDYRQVEEEKQLKLCTFKPKLLSPGKVSTASSSRPKDYEKSVSRMALARSRKNQVQQLYENLGKVRNRSSLKGNPPSMLQKQPKVILQIKVDECRVEKIKLYGNEEPRVVANRFVRKNGLAEEMIDVVEELIREYSEKYM